jgi:hypothetical protein
LKADVSDAGDGWSDNKIIVALDTSASIVYRVRKQLVEEGFEAVLSRKPRVTPPLCLTQEVGHAELSLTKGVQQGIHRNSLLCSACVFPHENSASAVIAVCRSGSCGGKCFPPRLTRRHTLHAAIAHRSTYSQSERPVVCESDANSDRLLDGDQTDLLLLPFYGHTRFRWELEDGCLLAFIQACEEHNVSIRKLQRIAVDSRLSFVDLPKDRCLVGCFNLERTSHERPERPVCVRYFTSKRHFRAWQKTHSRGGIGHRGKATGASAKVLRHQFVADFRWARAHTM